MTTQTLDRRSNFIFYKVLYFFTLNPHRYMLDLRMSINDTVGKSQCRIVDGVVYTINNGKRKVVSTFSLKANDRNYNEFHKSLSSIEGEVYGTLRFENGDTYNFNPLTRGVWVKV